jgi:hypothetical protein
MGRGTYGSGTYGKTVIGTCAPGEPSIGKWIVGAVVVGGVELWAKHQSDQIEKLYSSAGLPHQSFMEDLRSRSSVLTGAARAGVHSFSQHLSARKAT